MRSTQIWCLFVMHLHSWSLATLESWETASILCASVVFKRYPVQNLSLRRDFAGHGKSDFRKRDSSLLCFAGAKHNLLSRRNHYVFLLNTCAHCVISASMPCVLRRTERKRAFSAFVQARMLTIVLKAVPKYVG